MTKKIPKLTIGEFWWYERNIWVRGTAKHGAKVKVEYGISYYGWKVTKAGRRSWRRILEPAGITISSARALLAKRRTEIHERTFVPRPPRRTRWTFARFVPEYLEHARATKRRPDIDEQRLIPLERYFGDELLAGIQEMPIARYIAHRRAAVAPNTGRPLSTRTINMELAILRRLLRVARERNLIDSLPKVKLLQEEPAPKRVMTHEEEALISERAPASIAEFVVLGANVGLRPTDLKNLGPEHVDLERRTLTIVAGKTQRAVTLPLNNEAYRLVAASVKAGRTRILERRGRPLPRRDYPLWRRTMNELGIKGLRPHDIRRTFATRLLRAGVDLETIRALLDHKSIQTTALYLGTEISVKREAVARLDAARTAPKVQQAPRHRLRKRP